MDYFTVINIPLEMSYNRRLKGRTFSNNQIPFSVSGQCVARLEVIYLPLPVSVEDGFRVKTHTFG